MAKNIFENGFTEFRAAILKAAQPFLDVPSDKDNEYFEVFGNILFGRLGPQHLNRNLSPQEQVFSKIWRGYVEIEESFETLGDIATYIKHFPPKKVAVSKTRFLRLHIGNYLNEVYILKERLETYYKVVTRIYRKGPRLSVIKQIESVCKKLLSSFDNIIAVRGAHVHQTRYEDNDLNRLGMLELLLQDESPSMARVLYPTAIRETRKKWVETITRNNKEIARVMDIYFGALHLIIFDEQGKLISPIPTKRSG